MSTSDNITTQNNNDFLMTLMVLQEAEARNELDPILSVLAKTMAKDASQENAPFHLVNSAFSPASIAEVKTAYGDIWNEIFEKIEAKNKESGNALTAAGYSDDERANFSPELQNHFDIVREFEDRFPTADNQDRSIVVRLWDSKDQLFDALASPGGKKALEAASWALSFATGAVVTKLAFRGAGHIASMLVKNESVQDFAGKMQSRISSFLQRTGVPTGVIAARFAGMKENAKAVIDSPAFQRYGKPTLALAGIAMGALMLGEVNHDKIVEFAQSGFSKATDLANAGLDIGAQGIQYAASGISAGADAFEHGVSEGLGALSNGIDTALHSTSAEMISGGLATVRESATQLGDAISTLAAEGYHTVSAAVSDTVDGVTVAVTDGVHQARESVAGGLHGLAGQIEPDTHAYAAAAGVDEAPVAPEAPEAAVVVPAAPEVVTVTVSKGDSLWNIAKAQFEANGTDPTNAQIQAAAKDLYEANKDVIGTDPNRIFPGQDLKIDPALFGAEPSVHVAEVAPVASVAPVAPSGIHTKVAGLASGGELQTSSWASALSNLARDKHQVDLSPSL